MHVLYLNFFLGYCCISVRLCECVYRGGGEEKVNEEETWRGYVICDAGWWPAPGNTILMVM